MRALEASNTKTVKKVCWICGSSHHRTAYAILSDSLDRAVPAAERVVYVAARATEGAWVLLAAALRNLAWIDDAWVDGDRLTAPQ